MATSERDPITNIVPDFGAYVVFTLDAAASLEALEDPEATAQARALPTRKYVGYVSRIVDLLHPDRRYHRCSCVFLSQGLPRANPANYVDESMCVAVAPALHPTGRAAVTPSSPLPWDNLYHHSEHGITLRLVTKDEVDHTSSPGLSNKDIVHAMMTISEDGFHMQEQRCRDGKPHPYATSFLPLSPTYRPPSPSSSPDYSRLEDDEQTIDFDASSIGESSVSDTESRHSIDSVELMFARGTAGIFDDSPYQFLPVLDYTTDLSVVTEFTNAKHLFEEFEELRRIRAESEERSRLRMMQLDETRLGRDSEAIETSTKGSDGEPLPAESPVSAGRYIPLISHLLKKFRIRARRKQSLSRDKEAGMFLAEDGGSRRTSGGWKHVISQVVSFATGGCTN